MNDKLDKRRYWFELYYKRSAKGVGDQRQKVIKHTCPCCGYPTLDERSGYEICYLCDWEDDGQDDPHADEIWGGPNKNYSLTEARGNFNRYLIMYDLGDDNRLGGPDGEVQRNAKDKIIDAFEELRSDSGKENCLLSVIEDNRQILKNELNRQVREYEIHKKQLVTHEPISEGITELIEEEINGNWSLTNLHGVDLKQSLVKHPVKKVYKDGTRHSGEIKLWLVLEEDPDGKKGYEIVFNEKSINFGLATSGTFIGYYGSFIETFKAM